MWILQIKKISLRRSVAEDWIEKCFNRNFVKLKDDVFKNEIIFLSSVFLFFLFVVVVKVGTTQTFLNSNKIFL